mmetsp:Transcript_86507/g.173099  ORF Transcript_86507/g.173099 Transcript_86507/m.173099 type:complete len:203 (-) Transcript_86507:274-882(-)
MPATPPPLLLSPPTGRVGVPTTAAAAAATPAPGAAAAAVVAAAKAMRSSSAALKSRCLRAKGPIAANSSVVSASVNPQTTAHPNGKMKATGGPFGSGRACNGEGCGKEANNSVCSTVGRSGDADAGCSSCCCWGGDAECGGCGCGRWAANGSTVGGGRPIMAMSSTSAARCARDSWRARVSYSSHTVYAAITSRAGSRRAPS